MSASLLAYAPLACPLGMAAMMGIPALIYRAKRRNGGDNGSPSLESVAPGTPSDLSPGQSDEAAPVPSALGTSDRQNVLTGSVVGRS
jgi:hypothetical protein